jgi:neuroligin
MRFSLKKPRVGHQFVESHVTLISNTPQVLLSRTQRVIQYLGIPYAQPPVKELRFAPPVTRPLPTWSGLRNASSFGPSCPQLTNRHKLHEKLYLRLLPSDLTNLGLNEDCLFLNIYMPDSEIQ